MTRFSRYRPPVNNYRECSMLEIAMELQQKYYEAEQNHNRITLQLQHKITVLENQMVKQQRILALFILIIMLFILIYLK